MRSPLLHGLLVLVLASQAFPAEPKKGDRLVTGCVDRRVSPEFCGWTVRYHSKDMPVRVGTEKTAEQKAVEMSIGEFTPVQPAQIQGNRASILVQRSSGAYAVLSLVKSDGTWSIASVSDPSPIR